MIFNSQVRDFQAGIFAIDIDDKFFSYFPNSWQTKAGTEGWLLHQSNRIYLRLYVFIDSVLKTGFKDPIVVYSDIEKGHFNIHPGTNRIVLKMLLPEVRLVGWVVDPRCNNRKEYSGIFNNIKPILRDKQGNKKILWQSLHRTGRHDDKTGNDAEDQYDFSMTSDIYLGNTKLYDTEERRQKWAELQSKAGFSCYINDKYIYDIGTPQSSVDAYDFDATAGVYQAFLHHFFGYDLNRWKKLYFRRKVIK